MIVFFYDPNCTKRMSSSWISKGQIFYLKYEGVARDGDGWHVSEKCAVNNGDSKRRMDIITES